MLFRKTSILTTSMRTVTSSDGAITTAGVYSRRWSRNERRFYQFQSGSGFGTNNQVDGVDEADIVKSDGLKVWAAFGADIVVLQADSVTVLDRVTVPTEANDEECGQSYIQGLLLVDDSWWPSQEHGVQRHLKMLQVVQERLLRPCRFSKHLRRLGR